MSAWIISIFHRHHEKISRAHYHDVDLAKQAWKDVLDQHRGWHIEVSSGWSKRMKTFWGATLVHTAGGIPEEVFAIELWDRSLWSKDNA